MLISTSQGLFAPAGGFHIDPRGAVENAVVTHAHSDHARQGSRRYYCAASGVGLLRSRLGKKIDVQGFAFGEKFRLGGLELSFHPAGHILGSAQVRMQMGNQVWVVSGDYKREADPTCEPFETVTCDVFVTEATFGTPSYRWKKGVDQGREIFDWWQENAAQGYNSLLFGYSLGKTQRLLGLLKPFAARPIFCHSAASELNACYAQEGIALAPTRSLDDLGEHDVLTGELVIVPQAFLDSPRAAVLGGRYKTAFASGWMASHRHRYDRGFLISDHADWDDLVRTVLETKSKRVYVQHRGKGALVKHLQSLGIEAFPESALESAQLSLF